MLKSAHISKTVLTMTVSGCLYLLSTTSGIAGFEWVPKERPATPAPAPAQQEIPMQVMEAPVAHVTGEPLQAQEQQPQTAPVAQTAPVVVQTPPPTIIQQIPAPVSTPSPVVTEEQLMTPSPFDAPVAAPSPVATQPAPAAVISQPQPIGNDKPVQQYPAPAINAAVQQPAPASVEAMQQQQENVALEAQKLMQSMDVTETSAPQPIQPEVQLSAPPPASIPAPILAEEPALETNMQVSASRQNEEIIIPAIDGTTMEPAPTAPAIDSMSATGQMSISASTEPPTTPAIDSIDYSAQALAQIAEPRIEQNVNADTAQQLNIPEVSDAEPAPLTVQESADDLSIAEQAALKAEAAKSMLAERAARVENHNAQAVTDQSIHNETATDLPSLETAEPSSDMPVIEKAEKEVIILPPVDTVSPREEELSPPAPMPESELSINEHLEMEMSQPTALVSKTESSSYNESGNADALSSDELLARPEADSLVEAQDNIIIPAIDTTMPNEEPTQIELDTANVNAPLAPEARAVSAEDAQAIESAVENEAPLAPVTPAIAETSDIAGNSYDVVYGFGEDMPLALALQQIVPEGYAYSFTKSVNPGIRVNWEGDRPWNVVLNDTLSQAGLKPHISGNSILVMKIGDSIGAAHHTTAKEHPEAKTFDVMWDLEPAAGTEQGTQDAAPANALIAPLEPVSLNAETRPQDLTKKTIKDPGEIASLQPSINNTALESLLTKPVEEKASDTIVMESENELAVAPAKMQGTAKTGLWTADKGQSLKKVLYRWSQKGNVQIIWEASHDYIVANDIKVEGTLDEAMVTLFKVSMAENNSPSVRIIQSQKNSGTTAMVVVQDPSEQTINEAAAAAVPSEG